MNDEVSRINFLLDLFEAGYENAYVSVMNFYSAQNDFYYRIEVFLPNVGRMCLYQTFVEVLDEQVPHIDIFYSGAFNNNTETQIKDSVLLNRAARILYKYRDFFEKHPEHIVQNKDLLKIIENNEKKVHEQYKSDMKKYHMLLKSFGYQK